MRMLDGGHITFEQYLESCSLPFAQRLLARIRQNDGNATEA